MPNCVATLGSIYNSCGRSDITAGLIASKYDNMKIMHRCPLPSLFSVCSGSVKVYAVPMLIISMLVAALSIF